MIENTAGRVVVSSNTVPKKKKVNISKLRERDAQPVRGRFNYHEIPGGTLPFVLRLYKGDPVMRYDLKDGEVYTLPFGVARHLNNNVGRYEHQFLLDKNGSPSSLARRKIRRCSFENLEFMDIEDIREMDSPQIEEITINDLPKIS